MSFILLKDWNKWSVLSFSSFQVVFLNKTSTLAHSLRKLATYICQTNGKIILSVLCKPVPDTLYVEGSDFKDVSLEACQNLCKADRSCTFYTWNQRTRVTIAIYAPMIYTAPWVMLLMQPASILRASGRGLGPGNREFFGPVKWHRADRCHLGP